MTDTATATGAQGETLGTGLQITDLNKVFSVGRKSVVALVDIPRGQPVTREMIGIRRPGTGIPPSDLERLVGRAHREDIPAGSLLTWETAI